MSLNISQELIHKNAAGRKKDKFSTLVYKGGI